MVDIIIIIPVIIGIINVIIVTNIITNNRKRSGINVERKYIRLRKKYKNYN